MKFSQKSLLEFMKTFRRRDFQCEDGCLYVKNPNCQSTSIYTYYWSYLDGVEIIIEPGSSEKINDFKTENIQKIYNLDKRCQVLSLELR